MKRNRAREECARTLPLVPNDGASSNRRLSRGLTNLKSSNSKPAISRRPSAASWLHHKAKKQVRSVSVTRMTHDGRGASDTPCTCLQSHGSLC